MGFTALERMLVVDRARQRQRTAGAGFSTPAIHERKIEEDALPLLATNARGSFLPTRRSIEGFARCGFSYCPVDDEAVLLNEMYRKLIELSTREKWSNRCSGVPQAVSRLRASGIEPKSLVIPESLLPEVLGQEFNLEAVRRSMALQGFVTVVDGMQVLLSNLPDGAAIVAGPAPAVGFYTRVADHLGLLLQRTNRAIMVVGHGLA